MLALVHGSGGLSLLQLPTATGVGGCATLPGSSTWTTPPHHQAERNVQPVLGVPLAAMSSGGGAEPVGGLPLWRPRSACLRAHRTPIVAAAVMVRLVGWHYCSTMYAAQQEGSPPCLSCPLQELHSRVSPSSPCLSSLPHICCCPLPQWGVSLLSLPLLTATHLLLSPPTPGGAAGHCQRHHSESLEW
jgi:hypothetical protein